MLVRKLVAIFALIKLADANYTLKNILSSAFPKCSYCIQVLGKDTPQIEQILHNLIVCPVYRREGFKNFKGHTKCRGSIIVTDDMLQLKDYFTYSDWQSTFSVNENVLVFYDNVKNERLIREMAHVLSYTGLHFISVLNSSILEREINLKGVIIGKAIERIFIWDISSQKCLLDTEHNFDCTNNLQDNLFDIFGWQFPSDNITVSVLNYPPFIQINKTTGQIAGIEYDIINHAIGKKLKIIYVMRDNETQFSLYPWKDVMQDIRFGRSDMAVGGIWMSALQNLTSMTTFHSSLNTRMIVPKAKPLPEALQIFHAIGWITLLLLIFSFILVAFIAVCVKHNVIVDSQFTDSFIIWTLIRIMIVLTIPRFPSNTSLKCLMFSFIVVCLVVSMAFNSSFAVLLMNPLYSRQIKSFQDMVDNKLSWGCYNNLSVQLLRQSEDPLFQRLAEQFVVEHSFEDRMKYWSGGDYGFSAIFMTFSFIHGLEIPDEHMLGTLSIIPTDISFQYIVFGLKFNSPYEHWLSKEITRLKETGFVLKILKGYTKRQQNGIDKKYLPVFINGKLGKRILPTVSMKMLKSAYLLYGVGNALAILIFILELKYGRRSS